MRKKDPNSLNKREKAILKFIEKQISINGYPPSVREIGKAVDLKSTATVHGYIASLEKKGYIKKESQKGRTLKLLKGGVLEGKTTSVDELIVLAKLPSREELIAKLAGCLLANVSKRKVKKVEL